MPISGRKKTSSGGNNPFMNTQYQPQKQGKKTVAKFGVVSTSNPPYSEIGMNVDEYDKEGANSTEEEMEAPAPVLAEFTLDSTDPVDGSFDVILTKDIEMTFDGNVDPATVNDTNIVVNSVMGGVPVAGSFGVVDNVVTFTPDAPYVGGDTIQVTITTNVQNISGTPLSAETSFSFLTEGGMPII